MFALLLVQGCARFEPHGPREYVYVWPKETYLRDRVAVVSNRVAEVANGQRLQVVEHGRRFLKVKTDHGEVGWIEDHGVIDQKVFDQFAQLETEHAHDPVVSTGILLDDYWLRDAPGRTSDRFYLLPENDKLQLLERASVPKPVTQAVPVPVARVEKGGVAPAPAPPALEDYWLVRDSGGHVGWVRARTLDEDVPDAIAGLAEGQKIVGAYVLRKVDDPGANVPGDQVAEYLAVLAPWKDGLPYDFDQVRVFTWNTRKHRYETAYRERDIAGYLPVTVGTQAFGKDEEPVFSYRVATGTDVALDPQTGMVKPAETVTESFRMEGVLVHRIGNATPGAHSALAGNAGERREKSRKRRPS
ncbi:MAG: SH3 domain-containing protein [Acidobacteriaceae bacterium]